MRNSASSAAVDHQRRDAGRRDDDAFRGADRRSEGGRRRHPHPRGRRQDGADARASRPPRGAGETHRRASPASRRRACGRSSSRTASRRSPATCSTARRSKRCRRRRTSSSWPASSSARPAIRPMTWAMNVLVPAIVAETFKASRIVAFSTGCVYPFAPVDERRLDGGRAARSAGRICRLLPRPRAHVRIPLGAPRHARPAVPAELRHRPALRRPARHRARRCATASRSTSPWAMSTSSGRATPARRRCAA